MRHRRLCALDREVSDIGLGCWQIGSEWGEVSDAQARAVLRAAVDAGVTFFDTADIYGAGRSETLLGECLSDVRPRPTIVTKLGRRRDPGWPHNFTLGVMRQHVEDSLRRLRTDALDLLQLHCVPMAELQRGEVFAHLRTLQAEGKIRAFGASVESVAEANACLAHPGVASLQVIFNVFRQTPADALFDVALRRGVAILARLPVASGLLTGKFTAQTRFAADDHRTYNADGQAFHVGETFAGLPFARGLELVEQLRPFVPAGWSLADLAQRWILDHAAVTSVITGCSRPEQVALNARVSDLPALPASVHTALRGFYGARVRPLVRGND